jgi:hypothetical protein
MLRALVAVVLAFAATARGQCEQLCLVNEAQSTGDVCSYDCHMGGHKSAALNAAEFTNALASDGYNCFSSTSQVICQRGGDFGECKDHQFKTGC